MREGDFGSLFKALLLVAALALLGAFVLAGCGSDSGTTTNETTFSEKEPEPEPSKGAEEEAEEGAKAEEEGKEEEGGKEGGEGGEGGAAQLAAGKTVFTSNCAGCHTLADANASGAVGPNLDELQPDEATVQHQVEVGGGPMPAFKGTLSEEQITDVAEYVSTVAGK